MVGIDDGPGTGPQRAWVQYDDGTLATLTLTSSGTCPTPSRPGRIITEVEYASLAAAMQQRHDDRIREAQARDTARQQAEYHDLIGAGIPVATARRLSGYTGASANS